LRAFDAHQSQYAHRLCEILFGFRVSSILWKLRRKFERRRSFRLQGGDAHGRKKFTKILYCKFAEETASNLKILLVLDKGSIAQNFKAESFEFSEYYF